MNPLINPFFLYNISKSYLSDRNRLWEWRSDKIEKYRNACFQKTLRFAYATSVYRKKYDDAGVHINEITTLDDITKLPFVSKEDLRKHPEDALPPEFNIKKAHLIITSGTTGTPLPTYYDTFSRFRSVLLSIRWLKIYDFHNFTDVLKLKVVSIGGFSLPHSFDEDGLEQPVMRHVRPFRFLTNKQNIFVGDISEKPRQTAQKLDEFNPDMIVSYPGTLRDVATLKKDGLLKIANPRYMVSSGGMLDKYTEQYIKNIFDCEVIDFYASTEGDTIACRCREGKYHIPYDIVHVESIDDRGEPTAPGETGNCVLTRLFANGTPIIRYNGLGDLITLSDEKCSCGLDTPIIEKIEGRRADAIILPNGKIMPPTSFCHILVDALHHLGVNTVQRYQIIQETRDNISILLVMDESQKTKGMSFETIADEIQKSYTKKLNGEIQVTVRQVREVTKDRGIKSPSSLIFSKLK
jgi:phenylacetate-CoA ligase